MQHTVGTSNREHTGGKHYNTEGTAHSVISKEQLSIPEQTKYQSCSDGDQKKPVLELTRKGQTWSREEEKWGRERLMGA